MWAVLLIETGKGYVGRLRPYFARICYGSDFKAMFTPPLSSSDNTADWSSTLTSAITSDTQCPTFSSPSTAAAASSNDDDFDIKHELHDARRSFPSGHATLAVAGAAYGQLVLVRLARTPALSNEMAAIVMFVGWMWLLFSAWVSASRVVDNAHHVGDVAVGAFVGLWCAAMHYWYVAGRTEAEVGRVTDESEAIGLGKRVQRGGSVKSE